MGSRSLFVVCVSVGVLSLGSRAMARRGTISEEGQRRALLAQLAAASAEAAPEDRTDADLMYEAMKQWHGEPPESAAVDRTIAESKKEVGRERMVMEQRIRAMFWKDPFADEPGQLIPVRKRDRDLLDQYAIHHAGSDDASGGGEVARLRAEVSAARAEASRLRTELARVEGRAGGEETSRVGENGCAPVVVARHARRRGGHSRHVADQMEAWNLPTPIVSQPRAPVGVQKASADKNDGQSSVGAAPLSVASATDLPPEGWRSSDPRGIIVVPIETPVTIRAEKPGRAHY